jgi:hypothetical protein
MSRPGFACVVLSLRLPLRQADTGHAIQLRAALCLTVGIQ